MVNYESLLLGGGKKKTGGKMSYEDRCKNLEKARAARKKKSVSGRGQYNQDYTDESQVNYLGSPLDLYYRNSEAQQTKERQVRGEVTGKGLDSSSEEEEEEKSGGKLRLFKKKVQVKDMHIPMTRGGDMSFIKGATHTGMSMPTESQFKRGGKIKKDEYKVDLDGAVENLAHLASKFGLRLVK